MLDTSVSADSNEEKKDSEKEREQNRKRGSGSGGHGGFVRGFRDRGRGFEVIPEEEKIIEEDQRGYSDSKT